LNLIICADDYALNESVDEAILHLIEQKILSATSCMTLSPRWKESGQQITSSIRQKAAIGLHLDFTHFEAMMSHSALIVRSLCRTLNRSKIEAHIVRQLDAFESVMGHSPDYVDGHQHVHQLPQIRETLIKVLSQRYQNNLPWIRLAKPPTKSDFKGFIISLLGANAMERLLKRHGFNYSEFLLGVYRFDADAETLTHLWNHWLLLANNLPKTAVLMCHPGQKISEDDAISKARVTEWNLLSSDQPLRLLKTYGHQLVKAP
jgi:chitin disaccharide deacetylase